MIFALESDVNFTSEMILATIDFDASIVDKSLAPLIIEGNSQFVMVRSEGCSSPAREENADILHLSESRSLLPNTDIMNGCTDEVAFGIVGQNPKPACFVR